MPIDFLGVNYYTRKVVRARPRRVSDGAAPARQPQATHTEMDWEVYPAGLSDILCWVAGPLWIDPALCDGERRGVLRPATAEGGVIDDPLRVSYYRAHLRAIADAMAAGVDVRGYFAWSLLDNFEWNHGYSKRFGLIHVDYATQQRTLKASAAYYRDVIRASGIPDR